MSCTWKEVCYIEGPKCFDSKPITCSECGEDFCVDKNLPAGECPKLCNRCEYEKIHPGERD